MHTAVSDAGSYVNPSLARHNASRRLLKSSTPAFPNPRWNHRCCHHDRPAAPKQAMEPMTEKKNSAG